jgi:mxaJ protein
MPFSNRAGEGFENKIAALVAKDLGRPISYLWWPQRRGYVRKTLNAAKCDVWPGVAADLDLVAATQPYYRSTYVFVTKAGGNFGHLTLSDPRLINARIGVQMIGNDATNTPPAHAIADRGLTANVRGYMLYGDASKPDPAGAIVTDVALGALDVALVWGPFAGYFASHAPSPLRLEAVTPANDLRWPMTFSIAMGVRRDDVTLRKDINQILNKDKAAIDEILLEYCVPLADE